MVSINFQAGPLLSILDNSYRNNAIGQICSFLWHVIDTVSNNEIYWEVSKEFYDGIPEYFEFILIRSLVIILPH